MPKTQRCTDGRQRPASGAAAIALSAEHGFPQYLAWATTLRGWATAEQGCNEEGIAQIQESLAASRATGANLNRPYLLILLAEACTDRAASTLSDQCVKRPLASSARRTRQLDHRAVPGSSARLQLAVLSE
jgi:hypothetical protein